MKFSILCLFLLSCSSITTFSKKQIREMDTNEMVAAIDYLIMHEKCNKALKVVQEGLLLYPDNDNLVDCLDKVKCCYSNLNRIPTINLDLILH